MTIRQFVISVLLTSVLTSCKQGYKVDGMEL